MTLSDKIIPRERVAEIATNVPRPLVFTNGVFDLVHPGHVLYLEEARSLGAALFVGLNSDASTRLLNKAPDRPINPQNDRALILAALQSVTYVALFDEPTPFALMEQVRPDIYVKGGDYDVHQLHEADLMRSWGGIVQNLSFMRGYSSTKLLERIRHNGPSIAT